MINIYFCGVVKKIKGDVIFIEDLEKLYKRLEKKSPEKWKSINIDGVPEKYLCSTYGRVVNTKNGKIKELKPIKKPNGYYTVALPVNGKFKHFYIHRVIAQTFLKIPKKYRKLGFTCDDLQVNHKKGKQKWNNSVFNLEWVTDSENKYHAYKTKLSKSGEQNSHAKYKKKNVVEICELIQSNEITIPEISKKLNVPVSFIYDIKNKGCWDSVTKNYNFDNYKPGQQKYSNEALDKMKKLLKNGKKSCKEISEICGIKLKTVSYYKNKYFKS